MPSDLIGKLSRVGGVAVEHVHALDPPGQEGLDLAEVEVVPKVGVVPGLGAFQHPWTVGIAPVRLLWLAQIGRLADEEDERVGLAAHWETDDSRREGQQWWCVHIAEVDAGCKAVGVKQAKPVELLPAEHDVGGQRRRELRPKERQAGGKRGVNAHEPDGCARGSS